MSDKLVSMKMTDADRKEMNKPFVAAEADAPIYPWGLTIRLDNRSLEKLKVKELPKVGSTMVVIAKVEVSSVSANDTKQGENRNVELQITDLCLESGGKPDAAKALYSEA